MEAPVPESGVGILCCSFSLWLLEVYSMVRTHVNGADGVQPQTPTGWGREMYIGPLKA